MTKEPLSIKKIKNITGKKSNKIKQIIKDINKEYVLHERPFFIQEVAQGYSMAVKPEYSAWIKKFLNNDKKTRLSRASIETLAIIAYNQPVTRIEIEKIRGVDTTSILLNLLKNNFIKVSGRKKVPGNPLLYRVTNKFLLHFGLKNMKDLPPINELGLVDDQSNKN